MRWIVAVGMLILLEASAPEQARAVESVPMAASTLVTIGHAAGSGYRTLPEPVKLATLGIFLIAGSVRLRRRSTEEETGD